MRRSQYSQKPVLRMNRMAWQRLSAGAVGHDCRAAHTAWEHTGRQSGPTRTLPPPDVVGISTGTVPWLTSPRTVNTPPQIVSEEAITAISSAAPGLDQWAPSSPSGSRDAAWIRDAAQEMILPSGCRLSSGGLQHGRRDVRTPERLAGWQMPFSDVKAHPASTSASPSAAGVGETTVGGLRETGPAAG